MMILWFNLIVPEVYFNVFKHCLFCKKGIFDLAKNKQTKNRELLPKEK